MKRDLNVFTHHHYELMKIMRELPIPEMEGRCIGGIINPPEHAQYWDCSHCKMLFPTLALGHCPCINLTKKHIRRTLTKVLKGIRL